MASACKKIRKTYKHDEKIICLYCDNEMFYKNLKSHTDNKHGCKPVKYKAKSSKSLSEMWNKPVCESEIETIQEEDTISNTVVIDKPSNVTLDLPENEIDTVSASSSSSVPVSARLEPSAANNTMSMSQMSKHLTELSTSMKQLVLNQEKKDCTSNNDNQCSLSDDEKETLIKYSRSLNSIIKVLGSDFQLLEDGLRCVCCSSVLKYNYLEEGEEFASETLIPRSFSNFKKSLIIHLKLQSHISAKVALQKSINKENEQLAYAKDYGLHCASAAYTGYYFSGLFFFCFFVI